MATILLDDDELAMIAEGLVEVEEVLNDHGIDVDDDRELTSVIASALMEKIRSGETERRKLVGYAKMKAWAYLWHLDDIDKPSAIA